MRLRDETQEDALVTQVRAISAAVRRRRRAPRCIRLCRNGCVRCGERCAARWHSTPRGRLERPSAFPQSPFIKYASPTTRAVCSSRSAPPMVSEARRIASPSPRQRSSSPCSASSCAVVRASAAARLWRSASDGSPLARNQRAALPCRLCSLPVGQRPAFPDEIPQEACVGRNDRRRLPAARREGPRRASRTSVAPALRNPRASHSSEVTSSRQATRRSSARTSSVSLASTSSATYAKSGPSGRRSRSRASARRVAGTGLRASTARRSSAGQPPWPRAVGRDRFTAGAEREHRQLRDLRFREREVGGRRRTPNTSPRPRSREIAKGGSSREPRTTWRFEGAWRARLSSNRARPTQFVRSWTSSRTRTRSCAIASSTVRRAARRTSRR